MVALMMMRVAGWFESNY